MHLNTIESIVLALRLEFADNYEEKYNKPLPSKSYYQLFKRTPSTVSIGGKSVPAIEFSIDPADKDKMKVFKEEMKKFNEDMDEFVAKRIFIEYGYDMLVSYINYFNIKDIKISKSRPCKFDGNIPCNLDCPHFSSNYCTIQIKRCN